MKTRTLRYENSERAEEGVVRLGDAGWVLRTLVRVPATANSAEVAWYDRGARTGSSAVGP